MQELHGFAQQGLARLSTVQRQAEAASKAAIEMSHVLADKGSQAWVRAIEASQYARSVYRTIRTEEAIDVEAGFKQYWLAKEAIVILWMVLVYVALRLKEFIAAEIEWCQAGMPDDLPDEPINAPEMAIAVLSAWSPWNPNSIWQLGRQAFLRAIGLVRAGRDRLEQLWLVLRCFGDRSPDDRLKLVLGVLEVVERSGLG